MRKITAIAVALGFLTSVSLPAFATPTYGVVKTDELSAAKKKKKSSTKKSALSTDLSAKKKKSSTKKSALSTDLSAAKKKKKSNKKSEILYRIAA